MAFIFEKVFAKVLKGEIDFSLDDLRLRLLMADETAGAEPEIEFLDLFTDLDICDSPNYGGDKILTTPVVTEQLANDRFFYSSDGVTWALLAPSTRQVTAGLIYKLVNDETDSIPIAYLDDVSVYPFVPDDTNQTLNPSAVAGDEGWIDLSNA